MSCLTPSFHAVGNQPKRRGDWRWSRCCNFTVLQFVEGLSDRQAAEAVRTRIDWKYALRLELEDQGFDFSVLCEFRARLLQGNGEALLFEALLRFAKERGWLKARGRQRTDSTHVLAAIQTLSRLECVAETLRHALNVLAATIPDWVRDHVLRGVVRALCHALAGLSTPLRTPGATELGRSDTKSAWAHVVYGGAAATSGTVSWNE